MAKTVKPMNGYLLVEPYKEETMIGDMPLIVPDDQKVEEESLGKVLATDDNSTVKVGTVVVYSPFNVVKVTYNTDDVLMFVEEAKLIAQLED